MKRLILFIGFLVLVISYFFYDYYSKKAHVMDLYKQISETAFKVDSLEMLKQKLFSDSVMKAENLKKRKRQIRNNILSYIEVTYRDLNINPLGGIASFPVECKNNTAYTLDRVFISVDYIINNGSVFETQEFEFENVLPGMHIYDRTVDTDRGSRVKITVKEIYSRELSMHYNVSMRVVDNLKDPYLIN